VLLQHPAKTLLRSNNSSSTVLVFVLLYFVKFSRRLPCLESFVCYSCLLFNIRSLCMPPRKNSKTAGKAASAEKTVSEIPPSKLAAAAGGSKKKSLNGNGTEAGKKVTSEHAFLDSTDGFGAVSSAAKKSKKTVAKARLVSETSVSEASTAGTELPVPIELDRSTIERRAWEIWQSEGCPNGRELEHWLRAEQEILARQSSY
jgi:hypothetical protein